MKHSKVVIGSLFITLASSLSSLTAVEISGVQSATEINPTGGASVVYQNPNWNHATNPWFNVPAGGNRNDFSSVNVATFNQIGNKFILNFESSNGFGTASHAVNTNGTIFNSNTTMAPFSANDRITKITTDSGVNISVSGRTLNTSTGVLGSESSDYGVFLVGDRAENSVMVSGSQGITVGQVQPNPVQTNVGVGVFLSFDRDLEYFATTINVPASGPIDFIALFDVNGALIATYGGGVAANSPLFFGIHAENANIRSVWIGQSTRANPIILNDIAFVAAIPEASTMVMWVAGAAFLSALILRRRAK